MLRVDALLGRGIKEPSKSSITPPFDYEKFAATMRRGATYHLDHPDVAPVSIEDIEEGLTTVRMNLRIGEFAPQPRAGLFRLRLPIFRRKYSPDSASLQLARR